MKRTGVFATEDEIKSLKTLLGQPLIAPAGIMPRSPAQLAHEFALAHGLPEVRGYYGCDLENGEFVSA